MKCPQLPVIAFLSAIAAGCTFESPPPCVVAARKPDKSLTTEEYVALGMPDPDKTWSGEDGLRAVKLLAALAKDHPEQLPRYQSNKSGAMYARLTSPDNLAACRDPEMDLADRTQICVKWHAAHVQLFDIYYAAFEKGQVRDSEMVDIDGALMRNVVLTVDFWEEMAPTLDPNEEDYIVGMKHYETAQYATKGMMEGGLQALTEQHLYRKGELLRLIAHMDETFPAMIVRVPKSLRAEVMQKLADYQTKPSMSKFQPALGQLLQNTQAALAAGSQWKKFTATPFGVSADMPGIVRMAKDATATSYTAEANDEEFVILVQKINLTEYEQKEKLLTIVRDIYIERRQGTLISSTISEVSALPAIHYEFTAPVDGEEVLTSNLTAAGKERLYMFIFKSKKSVRDSPQAKRFLESAKIDEPK